MVSIFAKARICSYQSISYQVHLQYFCKSKLQPTQKDRAATQMHHSSVSSEISFHRLPSKRKCPSIRKQMALSLSSQLIVLVFTEQPSAERYLANVFFASVFCELFEKCQQRIKMRSEKFQKVRRSLMLIKQQAFTGATTECVL